MELAQILLNFASLILLPFGQQIINEKIPKKYRHLSAFGISLIAGFAWAVIVADFDLNKAIINTALIYAGGQTVYSKLIKE